MSDVTSVTNYFPQVNEGYTTTTADTVNTFSDTVVNLVSSSGLTNGTIFVGILNPGQSTQCAFTGIVDTTTHRITSVVWTRGVTSTLNAGTTVVDYVSGTLLNMITSGILKFADQSGKLTPTALYDSNLNEVLKLASTAAAVNEITLSNATTGNTPSLTASGNDNNIGLNLAVKGTPDYGGLQFNGVGYRARAQDWHRNFLGVAPNTTQQGTFTISGGTGWNWPSYGASFTTNNTAAAVNDEVRFKIYLDAGVYTFKHWFFAGPAYGQVTWGVINELGGTTTLGSGIECYSASNAQISSTSSGLSFTVGAYYTMFFKVPSKNASSTGYSIGYFGAQITRTA
jgi:hypothetical protein